MLVELLHKVAEMEHIEEGERAYRHRPSSAGPDRCIRQMVYHARGEVKEQELSGRVLHIFNDGHWHEELTNEWIAKTAFHLHSQQMRVKVSMLGITLCGSMDGILTDILNQDRVYEHKGLNHFTFEKYWNGKEFPEDYFAQTTIYIRGAQDSNPNIREALLVVKNKNTAAFLEYLMDYDREKDTLTIQKMTNHLGEIKTLNVTREGIVQKAFQKFKDIDAHLTEGTLPDRPYDFDDWHCQYCAYSGLCWSSLSEEVASLSDQIELEPELADTFRYYKEVSAQISEQEKEKEELKKQILDVMKAKQAKTGKAGEYLATMSIFPTEKLDRKLIPEPLNKRLAAYEVPGWQTRLTVSKLPPPKEPKQKKVKKEKGHEPSV